MCNIDLIMEFFDWNKTEEEQAEGLKMAQEVRCINVFLQPGRPYGKNVWENCAKTLANRSDEELAPYLFPIMEWLQDMNWPGAFIILDRLNSYTDTEELNFALEFCIKKARMLQDEVWEENLKMVGL